MALTITITDPKLIKLIQQKAKEAGVSQSEAAQRVLEERASEDIRAQRTMHVPLTPEYKAARKAKVMATLASIHELVTDEDRAFDYDAWLYDENGLPH